MTRYAVLALVLGVLSVVAIFLSLIEPASKPTPLARLIREDGKERDVGPGSDGSVYVQAVDFCHLHRCEVTVLYDQSGNGAYGLRPAHK